MSGRRRRVELGAAVLVVPLAIGASLHATLADGARLALATPSRALPAAADVPPLAGAARAHWQRFALNALLSPLLEPEDPPRWAAPTLVTACADSAQVTLEGRPLQPGEPLPERDFALRFRLADCLPFGVESIALSGEIEMELRRLDDRIDARVVPRHLRIVGADGRVARADEVFETTLALRSPAGPTAAPLRP